MCAFKRQYVSKAKCRPLQDPNLEPLSTPQQRLYLARGYREYKVLKALQTIDPDVCPNFIRLLDCFIGQTNTDNKENESPQPFDNGSTDVFSMLLDFGGDRTLHDFQSKSKLPLKLFKSVMLQVLWALHVAQKKCKICFTH